MSKRPVLKKKGEKPSPVPSAEVSAADLAPNPEKEPALLFAKESPFGDRSFEFWIHNYQSGKTEMRIRITDRAQLFDLVVSFEEFLEAIRRYQKGDIGHAVPQTNPADAGAAEETKAD